MLTVGLCILAGVVLLVVGFLFGMVWGDEIFGRNED